MRTLRNAGCRVASVADWADTSTLEANWAPDAVIFETEPCGEAPAMDVNSLYLGVERTALRVSLSTERSLAHGYRPAQLLLASFSGCDLVVQMSSGILQETASQASKRVLDALHARALAGDLAACAAFCQRVFTEVRPQLLKARFREDVDLIDTALDDALLRYVHRQCSYEPDRGHPVALIRKIALDCLVDLQRRRSRRLRREVAVGLDLARLPAPQVSRSEPRNHAENRLAVRRAFFLRTARSTTEREFIEAWLAGSPAAVLEEVLRRECAAGTEKRVSVHTMKMRLWKRVTRAVAAGRASSR